MVEFHSLLNAEQAERYGRQLLVPEIGVSGQISLFEKSVLIVGAGGLGCPVAIYLAAAGIGNIGIIDGDIIEKSNLHRQILHSQNNIGTPKVDSIKQRICDINSNVNVCAYNTRLSKDNAVAIIQKYDVIVDASDNPATRYLVNDVSILLGKPLVSGSALKLEGQLTVYGYKNGPCYRCLYPVPSKNVVNCADGGVVGCITGIIGSLQALEVIKIIVSMNASEPPFPYTPQMIIFDGLTSTFRNVKLRSKQKSCVVCGDNPIIDINHLIDYESFCMPSCSKSLTASLCADQRLTVVEYNETIKRSTSHILIGNDLFVILDVRPKVQFDICHLNNAINLPLSLLEIIINVKQVFDTTTFLEYLKGLTEVPIHSSHPIFFICRRGNASQKAVIALNGIGIASKDIIGGMTGWKKEINSSLPLY
jgi:adenylyltransferase/sulfurtransferase